MSTTSLFGGTPRAKSNTDFSRREHWEERYEHDSGNGVLVFEWIKGWSHYRDAVVAEINSKDAHILHLGCGNSALAADMYKEGYRKQSNIDYSHRVIDDMRVQYAELDGVTWTVADIFEMDKALGLGVFDVVIDKATFDAFLTGYPDEDPWNPSDAVLSMSQSYMRQIESVLKTEGVFLHITWSQPHFRRPLLAVTGMDVTVKTVNGGEGGWEYFVFVCRRKIK
ncbi:S-adenosyl-L-methionine-dependent methyltransferase [Zopfochytrium polystomum]|nr:S-adenosyl-L-methionine-dependent methyltransferase [Zopfochytrium polystomum]